MKTYRVTVVRMVEGAAIVDAESVEAAKKLASRGLWNACFGNVPVGVEVVGDPEEVSEPELINEGDE